jgi:hypothetical protein
MENEAPTIAEMEAMIDELEAFLARVEGEDFRAQAAAASFIPDNHWTDEPSDDERFAGCEWAVECPTA